MTGTGPGKKNLNSQQMTVLSVKLRPNREGLGLGPSARTPAGPGPGMMEDQRGGDQGIGHQTIGIGGWGVPHKPEMQGLMRQVEASDGGGG
eukprot:763252-Hanusia_phi.AAC.3